MKEEDLESYGVDLSKLKNYQLEGVKWLIKKDKAILADDMGLGKTLQVLKSIQILFARKEIKKVLVVCPVSLIKNWEEEIIKWTPDITYQRVSSSSTNIETLKAIDISNIVITNYENIRSDPSIYEKFEFDLVVADEVHKVRRIQSKLSKSFRVIIGKKFWALTGTPIENNIDDLINLSQYIIPGTLSTSDKNRSQLVVREVIKPYVLRRNKNQVLSELPEVIEVDVPIDLSLEQRKLYDEIWSKRSNISKKSGSFFGVLSKLRAICDGTQEYTKNSKVIKAFEIVEKILSKNEKVIIFSYYIEPLKAMENLLIGKKIKCVTILGEDEIEVREKNIQEFKNENTDILLASSKVASEGLNLTESNNVIFLNRWWNPSSNNQARDRVNRLGQDKIVNIFNIYCKETIEERVVEILNEKTELYEKMIDGLIDNIEDMDINLLLKGENE